MLLDAGIISTIFALLGVLLTLVTLPGIWIMLPGRAAVRPVAARALLARGRSGSVAAASRCSAEVAEALSSAAGSAKTGGTRAGVIGSAPSSAPSSGLIAGDDLPALPADHRLDPGRDRRARGSARWPASGPSRTGPGRTRSGRARARPWVGRCRR
jgi:hypothetical protein